MRGLLVWGMLVLGLVAVALGASPSGAQEKPDATITFSGGSVSAGIGYNWGSGMLSYQGKEYPFSIEGVSAPVVGGSSVSASGNVYHLKSLKDLNGNFIAANAEATVGMGAGATAMRNEQGVVITLLSTTLGLEFKLASSVVKISLK